MAGQKRSIVHCWAPELTCILLVLSQSLDQISGCPPSSFLPLLTLTEQFNQAEIAVLGQWSAANKGPFENTGETRFEVKQIFHQSDKTKFKSGDQITINHYHPMKQGAQFLLLGTFGDKLKWDDTIEVSQVSLLYFTQAPSPEEKTTKRFHYFLKFLEDPNETVAEDAFAVITRASFEELVALTPELPRDKIRNWVENPKTSLNRQRLYGLLLGLSAQKSDIAFMEAKITEPTKEFRLGIEGMMAGYLLQTGSDGLDKFEKAKLIPKDVAVSETYAAMQALRFMWTYGDGRISKERLRQSMQLLLDRPELTDLVVADLARWNDWSVLDRLMEMYGAEDYNIPSIKRAIVRYLLVASKGKNKKGDGPDAETTEKAKQLLDKLRKEDPKTVQSAERFFFLK